MGWVCLSLRRNELQASVQQRQFELIQLSRQMRQLSSFASMVGDGQITPTEIGSIGAELFGDAMDFMGYSNDAAMEAAQLQTDYYATAYGDVTANQYYNNETREQIGKIEIISRCLLQPDKVGFHPLKTDFIVACNDLSHRRWILLHTKCATPVHLCLSTFLSSGTG